MITFGRFGHAEDYQKDKEFFLKRLNYLIYLLNGYEGKKDYKEAEIIKPLKEKLKPEIKADEKSFFPNGAISCLSSFLEIMGLSYYQLTPKEKEEILEMDFTYDNWKNKSIELINSFIQRIINASPKNTHFCFDDIYFIFHIQIDYKYEFKLKYLPTFIRDYYILNKARDILKKYRNSEIYNNIQKEVFVQYPRIKEECGVNRILEKILSYFIDDTDYHYEKTRKILDDYYNKKNEIKNEESESLKDKFD
jgi:hypothetical protein